MVIDVPEDLCPIIDGAPFATAPSAEELHALLGPPSQITEPDVRAPVGHRNNRWHVYDTDGVFFYEHHYTRRINGCSIVLQSDEVLVPCVPQQPFSGLLRLGGLEVSAQTSLSEVLRGCGIAFKPSFMGWLVARRDNFSVILACKGAKLTAGHRSKTPRLVSVELSWPHDPWEVPVDGG